MLLRSLMERAESLEGVQVSGLLPDYGWFDPSVRRHISQDGMFGLPGVREAINDGAIDYTPWWIWGGHKALDEHRPEARPVDVIFLSVRPPNESGFCCIGRSIWDAPTTARRAKLVVAAISESIPRTYGDTWIHVSEIDWFVRQTEPAVSPPVAPPEPWDQPIAEYVGSLVKDGDTLQIGTGAATGHIPRSGALDGKHDLAYFAELTVNGTIDLARRGIITGRYLAAHPGKFVTATAGNSEEDVAFIDNNPMFEFYPVEYMHHPGVIGRNDNMVAINQALTVDLTGQIGAGTIGPKVWCGTGGHFAYAMGAFLSRGGRYICVLPSTAVGGSQSRIVPEFPPGQIVTVPRDIADIVVTEYGIARLLNQTVRKRAEALIAIAHPDFRAELRRQASKALAAW